MNQHHTQLALGDSAPADRPDMTHAYRSYEYRASVLMGGWAVTQGATPDDLAQECLLKYWSLRADGLDHEQALNTARQSVRQRFIDLFRREEHATEEYPHEPAQISVPKVFAPDFVDQLAEHLSPEELDIVFARYEDDKTMATIASDLGKPEEYVRSVLRRVNSKLQRATNRDGSFIPHEGEPEEKSAEVSRKLQDQTLVYM